MSTATTNSSDLPQNSLASMPSTIPAVVQQEFTALRQELNDARQRLTLLEQHVSKDLVGQEVPVAIVALDSPAMQFALALCQDVFPGCSVVPELMFDPESPARSWYSLNIRWQGESSELIERDLAWHRRFAEAFPEATNDFCLCSLPE